MFTYDTKKVLAFIIELTLDTDAETWTEGKRCVQEAMLAFKIFYDGK